MRHAGRVTHFYEPSHGHGLAHDPLNSIVAPRPIGWISTVSAAGVRNLAPYSFFNMFNYRPPIIGFCSTGYKDSVRNVEETGEFCWNLVSRSLVEQMNETSAAVAPDVDEFDRAGLTPAESRVVAAPHVGEAKVSFECRVADVHRLRSAAGEPADAWLTLGEVVGVHIADELIVDGSYQTLRGDPVMRAGGPADYFGISADAAFKLYRPQV